MVRKIVIVLLFLAGLLFILGGVIFIIDSPLNEAPDLPVWHHVFGFFFGSGFILLGILSLKRARCFRSTWLAFLLLLVRIGTFILAIAHFFASMPSIDESMANSTSEIQNEVGIIFAVLAFILLGVTILLTLANKDKSAKTTSLMPVSKYISAKTTLLMPVSKYISAKRLDHQLRGRYVIDPSDFGKDRFYIGALVVFWLIWVTATAFFTAVVDTADSPIWYLWLALAYLVIIIIPASLFIMNKKQILEVRGNSIVVNTNAFIPPFKVRIDKLDLQALTLEHYQSSFHAGNDAVYSLNLIRKGNLWPKRIELAPYVHPADKAILFGEIGEFLQKHEFVFDTYNEMEDPAMSGILIRPSKTRRNIETKR